MTNWLAGMRTTADRLYDTDLIGRMIFFASRTTNQSIPSGESASSAMQWNVVDLDVLGGWDPAQPSRWTCPRAGWWNFQGAVAFNASSSGSVRECCWYVNGGLVGLGRSRPINTGSIANSYLTVDARSLPRLMAVGDYVELVPVHNSSDPNPLPTATGSASPYMTVTYCGPA
ncbi:hypothetical protein [Streptomyces sp. STCH 565 A]|uniref:hypothetical protein n=1 Tax=Streptomyces sp. STCH 565 A TaxID=2950532 RepID=UPI0020765366|nr:hypothetical protein [Streptomyces sp. STCH 565 A]MCM8550076.1 hypothetical protein [Streptomyces sp. STCH 565 A]